MAKRYTIERFGDSGKAVQILAETLQQLQNKAATKFGLDAATLTVCTSAGAGSGSIIEDEDVFQSYEIGTRFLILAPGEKWTQQATTTGLCSFLRAWLKQPPIRPTNAHYRILDSRWTDISIIYFGHRAILKARDHHLASEDGMVVLKLDKDIERAKKETAVMKLLATHEHVIRLLDNFSLPGCSILVLPLYESSEHFRPNSEDELQAFMFQLMKALAACHEIGIIHADIKLANILYRRTFAGLEVVLTDFGSCIRDQKNDDESDDDETICGTLIYMAPELLRTGYPHPNNRCAIDIWGAGAVFAQLEFMSPVFYGVCEDQVLASIEHYNKWKHIYLAHRCPSKVDLLERMLFMDPQNRITTKDAVLHKYFENLIPK